MVTGGADVRDRLTTESGRVGERSHGGALTPRDPDHAIAIGRFLDCALRQERGRGDRGSDGIIAGTNRRQLGERGLGEVRTYGEMAAAAGSPKASRAAGTALGHNPVPVVVPCHRVLRAGGAMGGYTGGLHIKEHLLRLEGVLAL